MEAGGMLEIKSGRKSEGFIEDKVAEHKRLLLHLKHLGRRTRKRSSLH